MRKFLRRWFGPYVMTRVNNKGTYHLVEPDATRIDVPVAGKRINAIKKRHEEEPGLEGMEDSDNRIRVIRIDSFLCSATTNLLMYAQGQNKKEEETQGINVENPLWWEKPRQPTAAHRQPTAHKRLQ